MSDTFKLFYMIGLGGERGSLFGLEAFLMYGTDVNGLQHLMWLRQYLVGYDDE